MIPQLQQRFNRLELAYSDFVESLKQFKSADFDRRPSDGTWSANLVAEHLIIVEEIIVNALREKPARKLARPSLKNRLMAIFVAAYLGLGLKVKAPLPAIMPRGELSFDLVQPRWRAVREALRVHCESLTAETAQLTMMRHPFSGPLSAERTLSFLTQHIRHHRKQLERIRRQIVSH